ncbi:MAG: saccharopine dehydrogenase NADP-binding domain-containing protein [Actinomycetota bacterium]|nr:saccharopine dehydrogenase NADP-binding domain-containing protein [Actinomycetota bacterium]
MPDILLFGATGYTGRLTAHALARRGASFAIAGRNPDKLRSVARDTGEPEVRVAAVGDVGALVRALHDVKVMITCVGPFAELGWTAVEAALQAGVHYIDSTGEGVFIEQLLTRHSVAARERGIAMAPAMGFDEVPADVAATVATEGMGRARLVLTYAFPSSGSRGTMASALGIAGSEGTWIENGETRRVRPGEESRWAPMPAPLGPKPALSFPLAEAHLAPLHIDLESLQLYITTDPLQRFLLRAGFPFLKLASTAPGRKIATTVVDRLPEGPSERQRTAGRWTILAEARTDPRWRNVVLTGRDVYGLTAEFLSAGAMRMTEDDFDLRGVVSPVQVMGIDRWRKEFLDHDVVVDVYEQR